MKGLERLKTAIQTAVKNSKKGRPAERGIVHGSNVMIGQKLYKKALAVDITTRDGDAVWCQVTDDETTAVIVGA